MNELQKKPQAPQAIDVYLHSEPVRARLEQALLSPKKAATFTSSLLSLARQSSLLRNCDSGQVVSAALIATSMGLSLSPQLGQAYIVPFRNNKTGSFEPQFQIGYKGLIQLCVNSGQFSTIICRPVYDGELIDSDPFHDIFRFNTAKRKSDKVIGYYAYFSLINGFYKADYWTVADVQKHATRYSSSYRQKSFSPWTTNFDEMACKTVLKNILNRYAPKSVEMERAIRFDQGVVSPPSQDFSDIDSYSVEYADNTHTPPVSQISQSNEHPQQ